MTVFRDVIPHDVPKGYARARLSFCKFYGGGGQFYERYYLWKMAELFVLTMELLFFIGGMVALFEGFSEGANGESSDMILNQAVQAV